MKTADIQKTRYEMKRGGASGLIALNVILLGLLAWISFSAVAEATFSPSIDGLAVLPVKAANRNSSQILGSDGLRRLLSDIRQEDPDRLIIVDLPSITSASDARARGSRA